MSRYFNPIIYDQDDGLYLDEVGNWSQKKYKLVGKYCDIFTSGMRYKWNLIYMDLFSASGFAKMKESGQIVRSSSLISMSIPHQFDHYIFNDISEKRVIALTERVSRIFPDTSRKIYNNDANESVIQMLNERPVFNNDKGNLTFCFIDPFSIDFRFDVIKALAHEQVDILILLAMQMDARRNYRVYVDPTNHRVAEFTNNPMWREDFKSGDYLEKDFIKFLSDQFDTQLKKLNYITDTKKEIITADTGHNLYYLSFYSKHPRGKDFFEKIRKGPNDQLEFF